MCNVSCKETLSFNHNFTVTNCEAFNVAFEYEFKHIITGMLPHGPEGAITVGAGPAALTILVLLQRQKKAEVLAMSVSQQDCKSPWH